MPAPAAQRRDLLRAAFGDETVADPGLGLDVLLAGFGFEFFAQLADKDAQIFGLVGRLCSPDTAVSRARWVMTFPAWRARWRSRSNSLGVRWMGLPETVMVVGIGIDDEVAGLDGGGGALGGAAEMGATLASSS